MHRGWFILVLALVVAVPALADAAEKVKEPSTGIEFDATLDGGYELLGVGVRKKLTFKIYATALYVKVPDAVEPLRAAKHPCEYSAPQYLRPEPALGTEGREDRVPTPGARRVQRR